MRPSAAHIALAATLATLPLAALAEGAARVFACVGDDGNATQFTIAPVSLDASGKGALEVTRDGEPYAGLAGSAHGPFQFGTATDSFTLIIDGATDDGRLAVRLHHVALTDNAEAPFAMTLTPYMCETDI